MSAMEIALEPSLLVPRTEIVGILDSVRNSVLKWSLELEQKGVVGEGMTFSRAEQAAAHQVTHQITNNIGSMSNSQIQQHSTASSQTLSASVDVADLVALMSEIRAAARSLPLDVSLQDELIAEVGTLEAQASSPRPKRSIVSESLRSIRTILEGAAGNVVASEFTSRVTAFLATLG